MKFRIVLPMALLLLTSLAIVSGLDAQTKSDLPAGWDEPTELPPGAIRLEDVDRGVGPSPAPAAPAASTMPASPTHPPMTNQPTSPVMPTSPAPMASPAMAGSGAPVSGGDTRSLPVDMRFAPPEAGGMRPAAPMMPPPSPGQRAAAPISSAPPPPVATPAPAASAGYSDLPAGWNEETPLPAGAVRLEDVNSPYSGMTDRGVIASPRSPPPPAAAAPMAPAYQPPASTPVQPAYQAPAPEPVAPAVKKDAHQAPSRWENR